MLQIIRYSWKRLLRNKANMFWILIFPIALGTLFYVAFSNLGETESLHAIAVAVVCEEDDYGSALKETITQLSQEDNAFLDPTYCTLEEAKQLLSDKDVVGIIESGETCQLSVSANMTTQTLNQSILQSFVEEYNSKSSVIQTVYKEHPENIANVIDAMQNNITYNEEVTLQANPEIDTYTQYFYNQLAMACLFAAMGGVLVAVENQGNLSTMAARKNVSSTPKMKTILGELIAYILYEFAINVIGFIYLAFILKVGVAIQLPFAILALFIGVVTGVSLGFFIGCIGHKNENAKMGMVFAITMPMCFLSGLMIGNMRAIIAQTVPWLNLINPATLITDSFYCLCIYKDHARYTQDLLTLVGFSFAFIMIGILLTRRKKYASI